MDWSGRFRTVQLVRELDLTEDQVKFMMNERLIDAVCIDSEPSRDGRLYCLHQLFRSHLSDRQRALWDAMQPNGVAPFLHTLPLLVTYQNQDLTWEFTRPTGPEAAGTSAPTAS